MSLLVGALLAWFCRLVPFCRRKVGIPMVSAVPILWILEGTRGSVMGVEGVAEPRVSGATAPLSQGGQL